MKKINLHTAKTFLAGLCVGAFALNGTALANTLSQWIEVSYIGLSVYIDGEKTTVKDSHGNDTEPFVYNGTTYVPLAFVSTSLGQQVTWDGSNNSIYIGQVPEIPATPEPLGIRFDGSYYTQGDYPSSIYFLQDGTFAFRLNLLVGFSYDYGTYQIHGNTIHCTVTQRDWYGFAGDDLMSYTFEIQGDDLVFNKAPVGQVDHANSLTDVAVNDILEYHPDVG